MKKVIRLKESDLVKIVKRVISEQNDILIKKGYVLGDVNKLTGKQKDVVNKLIEKYTGYQYYTKGNVSLISDGKQVIFIVAPQGWGKGLGPHDVNYI
jgi:cupin superfamily acireductone dioxygenase involved in methionine salvage